MKLMEESTKACCPACRLRYYYWIVLVVFLLGCAVLVGIKIGGRQCFSDSSLVSKCFPLITPTLGSTTQKIYQNTKYGFKLNYPSTMRVIENREQQEYYDELALLFEGTCSIEIRAITGIDIYENASPRTVVEREVIDGSFTYQLKDDTLPGGYKTTWAILDSGVNGTIVIIARPGKNLFIEVTSSSDCTGLEPILSSFKFSE